MKGFVLECLRILAIAAIVSALMIFALRQQSERLKEYIDDWRKQECIDVQQPEIKVISYGGTMNYG